ncbi:MAG TPA: hypothetical protein VGJ55_17590 [Pyrinomonadaceae bacterium]
METLVDFLKNSTTLDLLVVVVTIILVIAGILISVLAGNRKSMYRLLLVAFVPLLLGLLDMFVKNRLLDRGVGLMGRLSPEAIAAGRREALVIACIGATGTLLLGLVGLLSLALKKNTKS